MAPHEKGQHSAFSNSKMKKPVSLVCLVAVFDILSQAEGCQSRWSQRATPVLELEPRAADGSNLIWYRPLEPNYWKKKLDNFLKPYSPEEKHETVQTCDLSRTPSKGKVCDFQTGPRFLGPCQSQTSYGFESAKSGPCIFLRLSKVLGWTPRFYNSSSVPKEMPDYLKETIRKNEQTGQGQQVWVTCEGEYAADVENLGPILYLPSLGFPGYYFPYTGVDGYLSPLVAVFFENPKRGVVINIICTAWAANIPRDKENNLGVVHLELLKD